MARELKTGIAALASMTSGALAILALASGVYTYIGVKGLLDDTGNLSSIAALLYSVAVSVGIFVFWTYVLRFYPLLRRSEEKLKMAGGVVLGSLAIVAMSSWLNAAALAGSAAVEQHLAETVEEYQRALEQAHSNALAAQSLLPDIEIAAARFQILAEDEQSTGALTGTSGIGTVVQLLGQKAAQLNEIAEQIRKSRGDVQSLFDAGAEHLGAMRSIVASAGAVEQRSTAFSEESVALAAIISELRQTSVAPAVKRTADDLARGFIAPAPGGRSEELRLQQESVIRSIQEGIEQQASTLSAAALEVISQENVSIPRFTPISTAEAVLIYAGDFVPSWAGAIAIDLLPLVIVSIISTIQGAIRAHEDPLPIEETMTLKDMHTALRALKRIEKEMPETPSNITNTMDVDTKTADSPTLNGASQP